MREVEAEASEVGRRRRAGGRGRGDDGENEWMSGRNAGPVLESTRSTICSSMCSIGDACGYQEPLVPA